MDANFEELKGKTITEIKGLEKGSDCVVFKCSDGTSYQMRHLQDCCEDVAVEDVVGDVDSIIGSEIVLAYADEKDASGNPDIGDSGTWTFYRLATANGLVVIRWLGTSNGYYSESVDFEKCDKGE